MRFDIPWLLLALPLALWPLWASRDAALVNAWPAMLPPDRASRALDWALRAAAVLALAALVVGLAGPYRPEVPVQRVGRGAEVVMVLDRSRSMDDGFAGARSAPPSAATNGPEMLDYYMGLRAAESRESKGQAARRLLSAFAAERTSDRFGMVVFSTMPMRVLDFTQKPEVVQAAITAGNVGRGLSETNIALALQAGLAFFDGRPYTGSRILLLVSDGGDRIDVDARERITRLARLHRVGLYWIYLRSARSPGLMLGQELAPADADAVPEHMLNRFFESLAVPYRAYEADNPEALQKAIADVGRLENLPINYVEIVPRRDLAAWAYGAALASVLLLLGAKLVELPRWA